MNEHHTEVDSQLHYLPMEESYWTPARNMNEHHAEVNSQLH